MTAPKKKFIVYNGPADVRRLGAADFAKSGVEHEDTIDFRAGRPFQVPADLHKALLGDPELYGDFSDAEDADDDEEIIDTPPTTGAKATSLPSSTGSTGTVTAQ